MGQQEVVDWLRPKFEKNNERWYSSKQIAKGCKQSIGSTTANLLKLRNSGMIDFKLNDNISVGYLYRFLPNALYNKKYI